MTVSSPRTRSKRDDLVQVSVTVSGKRGSSCRGVWVQLGRVNVGSLTETMDRAVLSHEGRDAFNAATNDYMTLPVTWTPPAKRKQKVKR